MKRKKLLLAVIIATGVAFFSNVNAQSGTQESLEVQRETQRQAMEAQRETQRQVMEVQREAQRQAMEAQSQVETFNLSKNINRNTSSEEYSFNVSKTAKTVIMSVSGNCRGGEMRIKIFLPNGQVYSESMIDASGNMNWRRTITISETENQDKTGSWKCQVSTSNATGNYRISVQVN